MKLIRNLLLTAVMLTSASVFAKGGDDVGNGGFAYKQSVIILKMATAALEQKIRISTLKDLVDHPERRAILLDTLGYDDLDKVSKKNAYRDGRKLAMDYKVKPAVVIILQPYFDAMAGKTDTELEDASLQIQKNLLHEAAHIWGYKEEPAEIFAIAFLKNASREMTRPTKDITIKNDFCLCKNGKSELGNQCDSFCAKKPGEDAILYANTLMGPETSVHSKLGNLYNWCTVQLENDETTPQCVLNATNGEDTINISVNIQSGSNSFTANLSTLYKGTGWSLKLVETKTGSNAETQSFSFGRPYPPLPPENELGPLKTSATNQYTCFNFYGKVTSAGDVIREGFIREYYYFPHNESPAPMPPPHGTNTSLFVCHDEQMNPGDDSPEYKRLELLNDHFIGWDKLDVRFYRKVENLGKMTIHKIIEDRLLREYNTKETIQLFNLINVRKPDFSASSTGLIALNYIMTPFIQSGRATCPKLADYSGNNPILRILGDYIEDTEGLYLAEREAATVTDGAGYKTVYGTMFITESVINNYGFYIEKGVKIPVTPDSLHTKTVYYYWPLDKVNPYNKGTRKLFTIKSPETMQGHVPSGLPENMKTTDKRIGCVPVGVY